MRRVPASLAGRPGPSGQDDDAGRPCPDAGGDRGGQFLDRAAHHGQVKGIRDSVQAGTGCHPLHALGLWADGVEAAFEAG